MKFIKLSWIDYTAALESKQKFAYPDAKEHRSKFSASTLNRYSLTTFADEIKAMYQPSRSLLLSYGLDVEEFEAMSVYPCTMVIIGNTTFMCYGNISDLEKLLEDSK